MTVPCCRIVGCVAFAVLPPPLSEVGRLGLCVVHQRVSDEELRVLVKRRAGLVAPLQRVAVGIEYERGDGTRYGYDHDGNYYDVQPGEAPPPEGTEGE